MHGFTDLTIILKYCRLNMCRCLIYWHGSLYYPLVWETTAVTWVGRNHTRVLFESTSTYLLKTTVQPLSRHLAYLRAGTSTCSWPNPDRRFRKATRYDPRVVSCRIMHVWQGIPGIGLARDRFKGFLISSCLAWLPMISSYNSADKTKPNQSQTSANCSCMPMPPFDTIPDHNGLTSDGNAGRHTP
jgi:hypothetical protein